MRLSARRASASAPNPSAAHSSAAQPVGARRASTGWRRRRPRSCRRRPRPTGGRERGPRPGTRRVAADRPVDADQPRRRPVAGADEPPAAGGERTTPGRHRRSRPCGRRLDGTVGGGRPMGRGRRALVEGDGPCVHACTSVSQGSRGRGCRGARSTGVAADDTPAAPNAGPALNPAQQRVIDLLGRDGERASLPDGLADELRASSRMSWSPHRADRDGPLWVSKHTSPPSTRAKPTIRRL